MRCAIIPMQPDDWPAVGEIYGEGIATGGATFETELPDGEKWENSHRKDCRFVACASENRTGTLLGWAALSPVSARRVYAGVAEISVYVAASARGQGIGRALLETLVAASERCGIWTLQAGIFPENAASIALHKSCGFWEVGTRRRIGKLRDTWRDVLLLERRSSVAGQ
jgi:L-amino acid N-acyltransferase YncA